MIGKISLYCLVTGIILTISLPAYATWEIGGKVGYDSNVNRTVDGAEGDTYLGGYLQYAREISGETRFDWTLAASLGGNAFFKNDNLNNALINFAPGIIYFPYLSYSINLSPFVIGKVSTDNDQSTVAFGAKINLRQPFNKYFYMGEYYIYTDSRAQTDIYSYVEHALGIYLGINWTNTFFTELGYEYSHGDSFQTLGSSSTIVTKGKGKQHSYSSTFKTEVYKDIVNRHSASLTIGMELFPSIFSSFSYIYSAMTGDIGTSDNHTGLVSIGYRF